MQKVLDDNVLKQLKKLVESTLLTAQQVVNIDINSIGIEIKKYNNTIKKIFSGIEIKDNIGCEEDLRRTRKLLKHCIRLRTKLVHRKVTLKSAIQIWGYTLDQGTSILRQQVDIASLRNEGLRDACIKEIMQPVWDDLYATKGLHENIETLIWSITNNQKALEILVGSWKEEIWAEKGV